MAYCTLFIDHSRPELNFKAEPHNQGAFTVLHHHHPHSHFGRNVCWNSLPIDNPRHTSSRTVRANTHKSIALTRYDGYIDSMCTGIVRSATNSNLSVRWGARGRGDKAIRRRPNFHTHTEHERMKIVLLGSTTTRPRMLCG